MQQYKNTRISKDKVMQIYRKTKIQKKRYKNTKGQKNDTKIQEYENTIKQKYKSTTKQ